MFMFPLHECIKYTYRYFNPKHEVKHMFINRIKTLMDISKCDFIIENIHTLERPNIDMTFYVKYKPLEGSDKDVIREVIKRNKYNYKTYNIEIVFIKKI